MEIVSDDGLVIITSLILIALLSIGISRVDVQSPVIYLVLMYSYLTMGPAISHYLGHPIYHGIRVEYIGQAIVVFLLGVIGLFIGSSIVGARRSYDLGTIDRDATSHTLLPYLLLFLACVSIVLVTLTAPMALSASKGEIIASVGSAIHPRFLLIQKFAICTYFIARKNWWFKYVYVPNFVLYLVYSLITGERDFIFLLAAILIFKVVSGELRIGVMVPIYLLIGVFVGTAIFNFRGDRGAIDVSSVLNQGSILFINTNILYLFPSRMPFQEGATYLNSWLSFLPIPQSDDLISLPFWFKAWYAPTSRSGYGFALDAEAYMNFGIAGVPVVFASLGAALTWVSNKFDSSLFFASFSVFLVSELMYSLRNDSWILIHSTVYAALFYFVVHTRFTATSASLHDLFQSSRNSRRVRTRFAGNQHPTSSNAGSNE